MSWEIKGKENQGDRYVDLEWWDKDLRTTSWMKAVCGKLSSPTN